MKTILYFTLTLLFSTTFAQSPIAVIGTGVQGWTEDIDLDSYWNVLYPNADGSYYYTSIELLDGYVKFVNLDDPENEFGGTAFPSGEFSEDEIIVTAGAYTIELYMNEGTYLFDAYPNVFFGYSPTAFFETEDLINFELPATEFSTGYRFIHVLQHPEIMEYDEYGSNSFPVGLGNGNHPIPIEEGYYRVFFSLVSSFYSFEVPWVSLVGTAVNGWPTDENELPDAFMESDNGFIYTLSNVYLQPGELKFREDGNWDVSWSGSDFPVGNLVASDLAPIVVPTAGYYDVEFNRQDQSYSFTTLSSTDFDVSKMKIYPNPTQDTWHFSFGALAIEKIELFSMMGALLFEMKVNNKQNQPLAIDATPYKNGIYVVKLTSSTGEVTTAKLVKS